MTAPTDSHLIHILMLETCGESPYMPETNASFLGGLGYSKRLVALQVNLLLIVIYSADNHAYLTISLFKCEYPAARSGLIGNATKLLTMT